MVIAAGVDLTAAILNNAFGTLLSDLGASDIIATSQTTTSTSYTNLATVGPRVTITSRGTRALCLFSAAMFNSSSVNGSAMAIDVSGATTIAAADAQNIRVTAGNSGYAFKAAGFALLTITPGSNTYTAKYKASAGTSTFVDRHLYVFAP